jgi:membrane protease YdiL (CAAX protease family)
MKVLIAAIVSEGLLVLLSVVVSALFSVSIAWNTSLHLLTLGAALAVPPLCLNEVLWRISLRHPASVFSRFSREIIVPLCRQISIPTALVVAVLSGACEEMFFRGALNLATTQYLGPIGACAVTSVLFAAIHFVGNFRRFGGMIPLYTVMGAYMWGAVYVTDSLFCAAVLHAVYNLLAILRIKRAALRGV